MTPDADIRILTFQVGPQSWIHVSVDIKRSIKPHLPRQRPRYPHHDRGLSRRALYLPIPYRRQSRLDRSRPRPVQARASRTQSSHSIIPVLDRDPTQAWTRMVRVSLLVSFRLSRSRSTLLTILRLISKETSHEHFHRRSDLLRHHVR